MLSRFQALIAARQCIFPQANTPLRKGVCVMTALVGLTAGIYGGYKSIPYVGMAFEKMTEKIFSTEPINTEPKQNRFNYSKIMGVGFPATLGIILSGASLISGVFLFDLNKETYHAISGMTKCCDIIRKTTTNTLVSSCLIVLCLGCGWGAFTCFKDAKEEIYSSEPANDDELNDDE